MYINSLHGMSGFSTTDDLKTPQNDKLCVKFIYVFLSNVFRSIPPEELFITSKPQRFHMDFTSVV